MAIHPVALELRPAIVRPVSWEVVGFELPDSSTLIGFASYFVIPLNEVGVAPVDVYTVNESPVTPACNRRLNVLPAEKSLSLSKRMLSLPLAPEALSVMPSWLEKVPLLVPSVGL